MTYVVVSDRLRWEQGSRLDSSDLAGCNIDALIAGGHLEVATRKAPTVKQDAPTPSEEE